MSGNQKVASSFRLVNPYDPYYAIGGGVNRHFFKPLNKVVSGVGSLGRNAKSQMRSLQEGEGINQFTNSIVKTATKLKNAEKKLKSIGHQNGAGINQLTNKIVSVGNKIDNSVKKLKSIGKQEGGRRRRK